MRCRDRGRRIAAPSRHKSLAVPLSEGFAEDFAKDFVCRSATRKVCGPGYFCQHRCCHCPRRIPLLKLETTRNCLEKLRRRQIESADQVLWFRARRTVPALLHQRKIKKVSPGLEPPGRCGRLTFVMVSGDMPCEASAALSPSFSFCQGPHWRARPIATCRVSAPSPIADRRSLRLRLGSWPQSASERPRLGQ